ncbi:EGF-like region domain-containing protein [Schistosoma japonicum]|uniref:EGF-like region domain-containing protein n=1 Tax=Schistosoma japonicum TaxID=6182 RepID=C1LFI0_SCHJA|nr:EGF-like region domain-containing protein [Schistosoma japonicum]CAX73458.1 EGF-like region domain-containing protein [Schistosoma japonicum]
MAEKFCRTYCFNDGECTSCLIQEPLHLTKCLGCTCPREWTGDRCEKRIKFLPIHVKHKYQEIPIGIMIGVFITCIVLLIIFVLTKYEVFRNIWIKSKMYIARCKSKNTLVTFRYDIYPNN